MNCKEYIQSIEKSPISTLKIKSVENRYTEIKSKLVMQIVSCAEETNFFDDDIRSLSFNEIIEAENDLHVDFKSKGLLPLFDCGENDFIVYHLCDNSWSKFNITDEIIFNKRPSLMELL